jgi:hypothetical protein
VVFLPLLLLSKLSESLFFPFPVPLPLLSLLGVGAGGGGATGGHGRSYYGGRKGSNCYGGHPPPEGME